MTEDEEKEQQRQSDQLANLGKQWVTGQLTWEEYIRRQNVIQGREP